MVQGWTHHQQVKLFGGMGEGKGLSGSECHADPAGLILRTAYISKCISLGRYQHWSEVYNDVHQCAFFAIDWSHG